jgi:hypothetical protein
VYHHQALKAALLLYGLFRARMLILHLMCFSWPDVLMTDRRATQDQMAVVCPQPEYEARMVLVSVWQIVIVFTACLIPGEILNSAKIFFDYRVLCDCFVWYCHRTNLCAFPRLLRGGMAFCVIIWPVCLWTTDSEKVVDFLLTSMAQCSRADVVQPHSAPHARLPAEALPCGPNPDGTDGRDRQKNVDK